MHLKGAGNISHLQFYENNDCFAKVLFHPVPGALLRYAGLYAAAIPSRTRDSSRYCRLLAGEWPGISFKRQLSAGHRKL